MRKYSFSFPSAVQETKYLAASIAGKTVSEANTFWVKELCPGV
jgi:hypothetical protein